MNKKLPTINKQKGAALMVALLLVFISALLGMTVLRSTTVEKMMITNEEIRQRTFHVAEAAATDAMSNYDSAELEIGAAHTVQIKSIDKRLDVEVTARQEGMQPIANTSIRLFGNYFYAIESTAANDDVSAQRGVIVGVSQRIPLSQ